MRTETRNEVRPPSGRRTPWKIAPEVEILEARWMPDAGAGRLVGTAYLDTSGAGRFPGAGGVLAGVTVELFKDGAAAPLQTATTDAQGRYAFNGLAPGGYTVVEVPPAGSTFAGSRVVSQVYPASGGGTNAVHVTVTDPSSVWLNYMGVVPGGFVSMKVVVDGLERADAVGPFRATLGTAAGRTDLNAGFQTFCLDDLTTLSLTGGEQFRVAPKTLTALTDGRGGTVPAGRAGRIAFLANTYGQSSLSRTDGAGLQLAIWELLYDGGSAADFGSGNFRVVAPVVPGEEALVTQALVRATAFFNESAGHNEPALLLDANALNTRADRVGYQSMIATESIDFLNKNVPSSLSGYVYCDKNTNSVREAGEVGLPGVSVLLTGRDSSGQWVSRSTVTSTQPDAAGHAAGFYRFDGLKSGVYTITEGPTPGFTHVSQTQGTPGNGVLTFARQVAFIKLGAGVNGVDNNFGEVKPAVGATSVTLNGIHRQPTTIVMALSGEPDPARAANPANYTLTALGADERLGTPDDRAVRIASVTYNPTTKTVAITPDTHLNIHYHYLLAARFSGDSCTPASTVVKVLGRIDVPKFIVHGKPQPPPPLTPAQAAHSQAVVKQALGVVAKTPAPYGVGPKVPVLVPPKGKSKAESA